MRLRPLMIFPWIAMLLVSGPAAQAQAAPLGPPAESAERTREAGDLLDGLENLILAGRYAEAQAAVRKAQRAYGLMGNRQREALGFLVLAAAEIGARDFTSAAKNLERGAAMLKAQQDRFSAWMALWLLGMLTRGQGRPAEAIPYYEQSLDLLRTIEASAEPFSADCLKYLGRYLGMPPDVLRLLPARPQIVKPILLRIGESMSRNGAVAALLDTGRLEEAETELTRLTELSRQLDGMFAQEAKIHLGNLRRRQWRLDEAREILRQALDEASYHPAQAKEILSFLTEIESVSGRHEEALALNDRALALARRRGEPRDVADVLSFRAAILARSDHIAAAEEALGEALNLAGKAGAVQAQAAIHHQLGFLALKAERPDKAAAHLETAARLFRVADLPREEARSWLQLALIYGRLNSRDSARTALERARELSGRSGSRLHSVMAELCAAVDRLKLGRSNAGEVEKRLVELLALPEVSEVLQREDREGLLDVFSDLDQMLAGTGEPATARSADPGDSTGLSSLRGVPRLLRGYAHYQQGHWAAARELWLAALEEAPRKDMEITLLAWIGRSYEREKKDDEAIRYLIRAAKAVEQSVENVRLEEFLSGYLGNDDKQILFADLIFLLLRDGRITEAFDYTERARARAFLQGLGNRRLKGGQCADPQLLAEGEEQRRKVIDLERRAVSASGAERDRLAPALLEARERYQSLLVRLKVTHPDYISFAQMPPLQLQTIQEQLPPDTTLVSYFVAPPLVHAWVLEKETRLQYIKLPLDARELRGAVCWAEQLGRGTGGRGVEPLDPLCGDAIPSAENLYEKLIAPLRQHIHHQQLVLIPHNELHYLPFAALRDPKSRRYLVQDFELTYAPSASGLHILRGRRTPNEGRALILGAPDEADKNLEPLPAAREEAQAVGRLFRTRPILGKMATEGQLATLSGAVDLLHIAAHGIYEPRSPQFSRIVLAPDSEHDGNLEVHEIISDLNLSGVNLVVLSACETARGVPSGGDEITSLTRAFLYAGSPAVISTLWQVDDTASTLLMKEFYRRLLDGTSVAEALRQAQIKLLHIPRYKEEPHFWAAFSLTGDPQGRWTPAARRQSDPRRP